MFNSGYNNFYPYQNYGIKRGFFSNLKGRVNWSNILNNTQKTLNIINQAIPVMYQIKPIKKTSTNQILRQLILTLLIALLTIIVPISFYKKRIRLFII